MDKYLVTGIIKPNAKVLDVLKNAVNESDMLDENDSVIIGGSNDVRAGELFMRSIKKAIEHVLPRLIKTNVILHSQPYGYDNLKW